MQEKIRHLQHNMYIDGMGVILLGLWSSLKVFMITAGKIHAIENSYEFPAQVFLALKIVGYILVFLFIFLVWLYHFYVGSGAIKTGKGRKRKKSYYFWAVIFLLINIFGLPSYFMVDHASQMSDTGIAAMLVDLIIIFITFDLLVSAYKLKKFEQRTLPEAEMNGSNATDRPEQSDPLGNGI